MIIIASNIINPTKYTQNWNTIKGIQIVFPEISAPFNISVMDDYIVNDNVMCKVQNMKLIDSYEISSEKIICGQFIQFNSQQLYVGSFANKGGFIYNVHTREIFHVLHGIVAASVINDCLVVINDAAELVEYDELFQEKRVYTNPYSSARVLLPVCPPIMFQNRYIYISDTNHVVILNEYFEEVASYSLKLFTSRGLFNIKDQLFVVSEEGIHEIVNDQIIPIKGVQITKHFAMNNQIIYTNTNRIYIGDNIVNIPHAITDIGAVKNSDNYIWYVSKDHFHIYDIQTEQYIVTNLKTNPMRCIIKCTMQGDYIHVIHVNNENCIEIVNIKIV